MMWLFFTVLLICVVGGIVWLERKRLARIDDETQAARDSFEVADKAAKAQDMRRDDSTVQTAKDQSATVVAKRGSSRRPRSSVLDDL